MHTMGIIRLATVAVASYFLFSCNVGDAPRQAQPADVPPEKGFQLTSSAFADGSTIPKDYTGDGADVSPPLAWSGVPQGTKSLALVVDDPDAPRGTWTHWLVYGMKPETVSIPEGVSPAGKLPDGARQGWNDFGHSGYGGPAPPPGSPHRYVFTLYALDSIIDLPDSVDRGKLLEAFQGHILARAVLTGTYGR